MCVFTIKAANANILLDKRGAENQSVPPLWESEAVFGQPPWKSCSLSICHTSWWRGELCPFASTRFPLQKQSMCNTTWKGQDPVTSPFGILQECGSNGITDVGPIIHLRMRQGTPWSRIWWSFIVVSSFSGKDKGGGATQLGGIGGLWQQLYNGWVETEQNSNCCLKRKKLNVLGLLHPIFILFFFLIFLMQCILLSF